MALPSLASPADLTARKIDTSDAALVDVMLAVASASVRGAAGSPILVTTSIVKLDGWLSTPWLQLPGPPVRSVSAVTINGTAVTDWRLAQERLWRRCGWGVDDGPAEVQVTLTHGLDEAPADIVDLVCTLASAGIAAAGKAGIPAGVVAQAVGDFSVKYAEGADAVATVMDLPERTRTWLRHMFGGSAAVIGSR